MTTKKVILEKKWCVKGYPIFNRFKDNKLNIGKPVELENGDFQVERVNVTNDSLYKGQPIVLRYKDGKEAVFTEKATSSDHIHSSGNTHFSYSFIVFVEDTTPSDWL